MEKINTDSKQQIWKTEAKLFNMRKPWLNPFKGFALILLSSAQKWTL